MYHLVLVAAGGAVRQTFYDAPQRGFERKIMKRLLGEAQTGERQDGSGSSWDITLRGGYE
jgi:hypothetical protein